MIAVHDLSVVNGTFSLARISFEVPKGAYGVLMGKTATGKTTILEVICGLKRLAAGRIELAGRDVTYLKPAERGVGYVPQDGALFPTMTVREHLAFALVLRRWPRTKIAARCKELANLLDIEYLLDRKPYGLSGGESQRVALGRALAANPPVLCLDEPLGSLDDETREDMRGLLKAVQNYTGVTTLHVTHCLSDAIDLGDKIFRLTPTGIQEITAAVRGASASA